MHPYSYNRLRLGAKSRDARVEEIPVQPAVDNGVPETGPSPDFGQLLSMMQAMSGGEKSGAANAGFPPEMMMLLTLMQAMGGGASGGAGMQNMLPLLSMLGGAPGGNGMQSMLPLLSMLGGMGMPTNPQSTPGSASGSTNQNDMMMNMLQGMMPPQTAQLMSMLSSMRKPA